MIYSSRLLLAVVVLTVAQATSSVWRREASQSVVPLNTSGDGFIAGLSQTVDLIFTLKSPFLLHSEGLLRFVNTSGEETTLPLSTPLYDNLKVVSHVPVSLVSILTPLLLSGAGLSDTTAQRLNQLRLSLESLCSDIESTDNVFTSTNQLERQKKIIWLVLSFINETAEASNEQLGAELEALMESLLPLLEENSYEAVLDYLQCLNASIASLGLSEAVLSQQLVVVLSVNSFSQPGSFLAQYYEQLLSVGSPSQRLVLAPPQAVNTSSILFKSSLYQTLSEVLYRNSSLPSHTLLSETARQLICSPLFQLPSCTVQRYIAGFSTRIEKAYVVLMMTFAGLATLLGIVVCCICYEDRVMATERTMQESKQNFKLDGPNVLTPLMSLKAPQELPQTEEFSATAVDNARKDSNFSSTT